MNKFKYNQVLIIILFNIKQLGNSSIGIRVKEGVVIAVEKKQESKLMIPKSNEKICEVIISLN